MCLIKSRHKLNVELVVTEVGWSRGGAPDLAGRLLAAAPQLGVVPLADPMPTAAVPAGIAAQRGAVVIKPLIPAVLAQTIRRLADACDRVMVASRTRCPDAPPIIHHIVRADDGGSRDRA